jgi:hypothetical protein
MISAYHQNWMKPLVCPLLNIVVDVRTSEKSDSRKMTQRWIQAGNKMQVPKEASRYHQVEFSLRVVATQIPKPRLPNTYFLSSLFKSRGRDFFKGGSLSRPRILSISGGNFFVFVLLEMIEISQRFKTFWVYLKALFENYLKSSIYFLKNFFEKDQVSKYYFPSFIQTLFSFMQACLPKIVLQNLLYSIWVAFQNHNWVCFSIIIL